MQPDPDSDSPAPQDERGMYWFDNVAEPAFGAQGSGVLINVHPESACEGRNCCIHNPSDHPLIEAPLNWRADRAIMERICEHGVGHDDPDDLAYRQSVGREASGIHGCCGCCRTNGGG